MHTVVMPKMGDTMEEGKILTWLKQEGDTVERGEALAEIETEKVNIEAEAFSAGVLRKILVPAGQTVPVGAPIALTGTADENFAPLHTPGRYVDTRQIPLAPINERLMATSRSDGLRPFRLPLAIDTARCRGCDACAGYLCPHGARRSATQVIDEMSASHTLRVMTDTEVVRLLTG